MMESNKAVTRLAVGLTVLLLLAAGLVIAFGVLVALNGFSGRHPTIVFAAFFFSQGLSLFVVARLAAKVSGRLVEKADANKVLAVLAGVIPGVVVGVLISGIGSLLGIFIAEAV